MKRSIILCYHKVGTDQSEGRRLNIEPTRLDAHVRYFHRRGVPIRRATDLREPWPTLSACFTFDDAYVSACTNAPTILERWNARGSFYAVTQRVGATSSWDGELARPLADWQTLIDLARRGHEIGNHTARHELLSDLPPERQLSTIEEAHADLTQHGIPATTFCFPYGGIGSPDPLARAGYQLGLALEKRIATTADPAWRLPRIVAAYSDAIPLLLYKIHIRPRMRQSSAVRQ